jgi:hypothetical protein
MQFPSTRPANSKVAIGRPLATLFFDPQKNDGDFIDTRKAELPARKGQDGNPDREQRDIDERDLEQISRMATAHPVFIPLDESIGWSWR